MGLQIDILTEMIVALGALVPFGSIVDPLIFPKIVMKNVPHHVLSYIILIVIMLRYAHFAGTGVAFLWCVSNCVFSD